MPLVYRLEHFARLVFQITLFETNGDDNQRSKDWQPWQGYDSQWRLVPERNEGCLRLVAWKMTIGIHSVGLFRLEEDLDETASY